MKKLKLKEKRGITLISLVITIIILMILAGVTINLTIGNEGLFNLAKRAKGDYEQAIVDEEVTINDLYEYLAREEGLPENSKDIVAGTEVKLPEGWYSTETGKVAKEAKDSSVIAVATGKGETVPVPGEFYYVGGNFSTGVVISDNKNDQNKYVGITDLNGNAYVGTDLEGNQFVWIPCTVAEYKKCETWDGTTQTNATLADAWWDTTTYSSELPQIKKYGGFYVARYEAGLATTIPEHTTVAYYDGSNQNYNKNGIPQSKAGVVPWTFIDFTTSQKNAQSMYNTSCVSSGLITGTQWDVMLNKIASVEGKSLTDSGTWGNHYNTRLIYTGRYATYDYSHGIYPKSYMTPWSTFQTNATKNANTYVQLTTGASETTKAYNLYDVAGNVGELTEEISYGGGNTENQYINMRGGSWYWESYKRPVCYRFVGNSKEHGAGVGFRVVIYIK